MHDATSVAELVTSARARAGLSQRELAERSGTSQSAIARLEGGGGNPTLSTLDRLVASAGFALRWDLVPRYASDQLVEAYKRDVDRTLLRENLRRSVDDRLLMNAELLSSGAALESATQASRGG